MSALLRHAAASLTLNFRNRMALIYGYLFPLMFLLAFWAVYRHDRTPLAQHMGAILTITALGSACFGLPTTLVSERERGVWRRYRLTPTPTWVFLVSTLAVRYLLLLTAALIQLGLALALGMSFPAHPLGLLVAFTFTAIAFMGLGLVIAMVADNVPAVQALGQCIFLPMLMIGGVAVQLSSLPNWAQHVSALFPGRYAVQALQAAVGGRGLGAVQFELLALLLIGVAGLVAAVKMFRWEPGRLTSRNNQSWILLALTTWLAVGLLAEWQGRIITQPSAAQGEMVTQVGPAAADYRTPMSRTPASWHDVTQADIANVAFERLPPDNGVIAPIAALSEEPDPAAVGQLDIVRSGLADWTPAKVTDPVQRSRNLLYVAAVPDLLQIGDIERFLPAIVLGRLRQSIPPADLPKVLYWVALHPQDGDDAALGELKTLGLPGVSGPTRRDARGRVMLYAFKLLARTSGGKTSE